MHSISNPIGSRMARRRFPGELLKKLIPHQADDSKCSDAFSPRGVACEGSFA
jgi:hypothetical protein